MSKVLKVHRFYKYVGPINLFMRPNPNPLTIRFFGLTSKLNKETKKSQFSDLEKRFKQLISEYIDSSSPLNSLFDRWASKPWLKLFEQSSSAKNIEIKERKTTPSLKDGVFRMAFDLAGFTTEDIEVILSQQTNVLYIVAKKQEITKDGSKSSREFSFECQIDGDVDTNSLIAYLDNGGLLVIEANSAKESLSGVTKKK